VQHLEPESVVLSDLAIGPGKVAEFVAAFQVAVAILLTILEKLGELRRHSYAAYITVCYCPVKLSGPCGPRYVAPTKSLLGVATARPSWPGLELLHGCPGPLHIALTQYLRVFFVHCCIGGVAIDLAVRSVDVVMTIVQTSPVVIAEP